MSAALAQPPAAWSPGRLMLAPGQGADALRRERPRGLERLWIGQAAAAYPARVAAVHALCSTAHRATAERALQAARGEEPAAPLASQATLRQALLTEHLRRLLHDWPTAVPLDAAHTAASLATWRAAPWREAGPSTAWTAWWQDRVLGLPLDTWLDRVAGGGEAALTDWCAGTDTPVARWLHAARAEAGSARLPVQPLQFDHGAACLPFLAARLAADDGGAFAAAPEGPQGPLETGPWVTVTDRVGGHAHNAWMRMVGRLVEAVWLARPARAALPHQGSLDGGPGCGMAWSGTARGLLLHWLRLGRNAAGAEVVDACRIVSPTDWNFHPRGGFARWLGALPPGPGAERQARWMALAFDACVPLHWSVASVAPEAEAADA